VHVGWLYEGVDGGQTTVTIVEYLRWQAKLCDRLSYSCFDLHAAASFREMAVQHRDRAEVEEHLASGPEIVRNYSRCAIYNLNLRITFLSKLRVTGQFPSPLLARSGS
jgi:hypothetical protein